MIKFNISKPGKYIAKDGQEKTFWANVGTMTEFDNGNRIIEIPAIGLKASVFEAKERDSQPGRSAPRQSTSAPRQSSAETTIEYPAEDINPEDIPF